MFASLAIARMPNCDLPELATRVPGFPTSPSHHTWPHPSSSHLIAFELISPHLISPHLTSFHIITSHLVSSISSSFITSHIISYHLISSHIVLSHRISSHHISPHQISPHPSSTYLVPSHLISPRPISYHPTASLIIPFISSNLSSSRRISPWAFLCRQTTFFNVAFTTPEGKSSPKPSPNSSAPMPPLNSCTGRCATSTLHGIPHSSM